MEYLLLFVQFLTLLAVVCAFGQLHAGQRALQRSQHEHIAMAVRKERERLLIENAP